MVIFHSYVSLPEGICLVLCNHGNLIFHIWDVILPIDEVHHFSRWLKKNTMQMMIINGFSLWIYLFTDSHLNIPTWQRWKIFVRGGFWPIAISLSISFNEILYIRYKAKRRQTRMDWPSEIVLACISARWFGTMEFYDFPSSWEYFFPTDENSIIFQRAI